MFILSLMAFFNAYSYVILGVYIVRLNPKSMLNRLAAGVNLSFAMWSFSYVFFYSAPTAESAMFWHRLSSLGWIMFCPVATHFFLILAHWNEKLRNRWQPWLIYILPLVLLAKSVFTDGTVVAEAVVQSEWNLGWTYVSNMASVWPYIYSGHVLVYFLIALSATHRWAVESGRMRFVKQAKTIIRLDAVMISIGFFTDVLLPGIGPYLPPVYATFSLVWGLGFYYIIKALKLMSVGDVATSDLLLQTSMDPILLLDHDGIIRKHNLATEDLLKYSADQIIGRPLSDFFASLSYNPVFVEQLMIDKVLRNIEIKLVDANGQYIFIRASFSLAENKLDGVVGVVVNMHDITRLKQVEADLHRRNEKYMELSMHMEKLANYDQLTDLPNRRWFVEKLKTSIEAYKVEEIGFMLAFVDLNGFKAVNDSYGHDIGDLLLKAVAADFKHSLRGSDTVARIGGDEFVFVFSNLESMDEIQSIMGILKHSWSQAKLIGKHPCTIGLSIGFAVCPDDGTDVDTLMRLADERMYIEKSAYKAENRECER